MPLAPGALALLSPTQPTHGSQLRSKRMHKTVSPLGVAAPTAARSAEHGFEFTLAADVKAKLFLRTTHCDAGSKVRGPRGAAR